MLALHSPAPVDAEIPLNPSYYTDKQASADVTYAAPDNSAMGYGMASSTPTPDDRHYEVFRDPVASGHASSRTPTERRYEVFRDPVAPMSAGEAHNTPPAFADSAGVKTVPDPSEADAHTRPSPGTGAAPVGVFVTQNSSC